jgi:23S rRNA pseudoU1915 N3-methylase RlmH
LAPKAFTLVLDERGKSLSSEAFSQLLQRHLDRGTQDLAFLIGGPTATVLNSEKAPDNSSRSAN